MRLLLRLRLLLACLHDCVELQGMSTAAQDVCQHLSALQLRETVRQLLGVVNPFPDRRNGLHALVQDAELNGRALLAESKARRVGPRSVVKCTSIRHHNGLAQLLAQHGVVDGAIWEHQRRKEQLRPFKRVNRDAP